MFPLLSIVSAVFPLVGSWISETFSMLLIGQSPSKQSLSYCCWTIDRELPAVAVLPFAYILYVICEDVVWYAEKFRRQCVCVICNARHEPTIGVVSI